MRRIPSAVFLTLLISCASTPSLQVRQAAQKYRLVSRWMDRAEVYKILGEPQSTLPDGREQWLVTDKRERAELLLRFNPDGKITEMEQKYPVISE